MDVSISFSAKGCRPMIFPPDDAFVMRVNIHGFDVYKVLIHGGISVDVLLCSALEKMGSPEVTSSLPLPRFKGSEASLYMLLGVLH